MTTRPRFYNWIHTTLKEEVQITSMFRESVSGCSKRIWRRITPKYALDFERGIGSKVKQTGLIPSLRSCRDIPHTVCDTHT